jgi:hypothetical protein
VRGRLRRRALFRVHFDSAYHLINRGEHRRAAAHLLAAGRCRPLSSKVWRQTAKLLLGIVSWRGRQSPDGGQSRGGGTS